MHIQKSNVFVRTFNFHTTVGEPIGKIMNFYLKNFIRKSYLAQKISTVQFKESLQAFQIYERRNK